MRSWQVERRKRTRHLIELGGLVVKAAVSATPCTVELSMTRLSMEPPLTFSHCPLFTIAIEPPLNVTLLVPLGAAIEALLGLVRITPLSVALPPLTLSALEPAPLAVSAPPVIVNEPPADTAAACAPAPDVVELAAVAVIDEPAPVASKPKAVAPPVGAAFLGAAP
jgi:hypothetical protein